MLGEAGSSVRVVKKHGVFVGAIGVNAKGGDDAAGAGGLSCPLRNPAVFKKTLFIHCSGYDDAGEGGELRLKFFWFIKI